MASPSDAETLHNRLWLKRTRNTISRASLARRLGASYTTVWRWENGYVDPPPSTMYAWKAALEELVQAKKAFSP